MVGTRLLTGQPATTGNASNSTWRNRLSGISRNGTRLAKAIARGIGLLPICLAGQAYAQAESQAAPTFGAVEIIQLAVFAGIVGAALFSAVTLMRERARIAAENRDLRGKIVDLNAALQRTESLLNLRDQRIVAWPNDRAKPDLIGALPAETGVPDERATFLAFGRWLSRHSASAIDYAIVELKEEGKAFDLVVETQSGVALEAQGRKTASHLIVRFLSLSESQRVQARLRLENQRLTAAYDTMLGMLDALRMPFWLRGADGGLRWVNKAYVEAVETGSAEDAVQEGREFLGTLARESIEANRKKSPVFDQTVSTVIAGDRRIFAVTDYAGEDGSAGLASDISTIQAVRDEHQRTVQSHADTLDQLNTAVAIFDGAEKLRFFNQAFQKLWGFETAFLTSAPDHTLLLDRLRAEGKIAEQPEWRRWKESLLSAYRAVEPAEHWWHLPDGRTIRVLANPQPKGGATWVFEDLTERMNLESRYNTVVRVQGETLDNLAEGVAVFGPDGRIRLANPAFAALWRLDHDLVASHVHISEIREKCEALAVDSPWPSFVASVTGFDEERHDRHGQTDLSTGVALRHAVIHLPNGQVMITFVDVTDSVNVERALKDKNDALERADRLKNDFVQHVSYELRSPLTNIIGFSELLSLPATGALNGKQRDYLDHIGSSSSVLLTIVNDILDLATVDAGIMQLDISEVEVQRAITGASELVGDRLAEHGIRLQVDAARAPSALHGDETRIRQILYNLLTNAANYAPQASTITLACRQVSTGVEFAVHDDGPGMSAEVLDTVFRRFEPRVNGGRRRGAGLGLAIVKSFVELHGGSVRIDTGQGIGTTVTCFFPMAPQGLREAAE